MNKGEDDDYEELRRRLGRVELLASLSLIGSNADWDEGTRRSLGRFLRDFALRGGQGKDRGGFWDYPEFDYLLDRVSSAGSSRSSRIESDLSSFKEQQSALTFESERKIAEIFERLSEINSSVASLLEQNTVLSADTHAWLAMQSLGIDTSEVKITRFIPVRVYLSDLPQNHEFRVSAAIKQVLAEFNFKVSDDFTPIIGSWYKKWFANTVDIVTQPEVIERLEKIERAVELKGLGQPQADIDAKQSDAVSNLLKALENIPNAAVQVGSILLVKITSSDIPTVQVRTLTQRELIYLENNQKMLKSPANILDNLTQLCRPPENKVGTKKRRNIRIR